MNKRFVAVVLFLLSSAITVSSETDQELNPSAYFSCMFTDLCGVTREVIVPSGLLDSAIKHGLNFDGSSIPGMTSITESDLMLKLDTKTTKALPWTENSHRMSRIMCDVYQDEHTPYAGDPRQFLKNAITEIRALGFDFFVGPELEFFLCRDTGSEYPAPCDQQRYFSTEPNLNMNAFKIDLFNMLLEQGIPIEKLHHEVAPGQHEMSIKYSNALTMADYLIATKQTIRLLAHDAGLKVTFMPKPFYGMNGSGLHINFSLWDIANNCNAFYDGNDAHKLSPVAKKFIAGVLNHIMEINAVFNPTINSYKRLVPGFEAPLNICWGTKNRSAMIRIPRINDDQPYALRGEIRSPDPSTNPYLAFGALLKAGIDGIKQNMILPDPIEDNLYHLTNQERTERNIGALPHSLEQAVQLMSNSSFAQELFGSTLHSEFIKCKQKEIADYSTYITNWELQQLFEG